MLTDISFKAEKGETIAVIGSTGSGKSTLVNLIPRFYDVTKGRIIVDGVDVRDMTQKDVRSRLGYVPQKGVLFSGTIDSNIRYGKTDISVEEVKEAAEIAQATEFIDAKPETVRFSNFTGRNQRIRWSETASFHCKGNRQETGDIYF